MLSNLTLSLLRVSWVGFMVLFSAISYASTTQPLSFISHHPNTDEVEVKAFFDAGIGAGFGSKFQSRESLPTWFGGNLSVNLALPNSGLLSMHISSMEKFVIFGNSTSAYAGGILFGVWVPGKSTVATVQGGFGLMSITEETSSLLVSGLTVKQQLFTVNFPVVVSVFLQRERFAGVGIKGELDINPKYILALGTLCLRLGNPKN